MTTKPHSNEEVISDFESRYSYLYQGTVYENGGGNFAPVHESVKNYIRTLLAQKDAEIADARREEKSKKAAPDESGNGTYWFIQDGKRISSIYTDELSMYNDLWRFMCGYPTNQPLYTPPDQTDTNPTN